MFARQHAPRVPRSSPRHCQRPQHPFACRTPRAACVADLPRREGWDEASLGQWKYVDLIRSASGGSPLPERAPPAHAPLAARLPLDVLNNAVATPRALVARRFKRYRLNIGICLINEYNQVFVARRSDDGGSWQMPQGGIHLGENPMDACLRELTEEVGLQSHHVEFVQESRRWLRYQHDFSCHDDLTGLWTEFAGQSQRWFLFRLKPGAEDAIDLEAEWRRTGGAEPPEFTDWRWMALEDVPNQVPPFKRAVYRRVADEFGYTFSLMSLDMDDEVWREHRALRQEGGRGDEPAIGQ